MAIKYLEDDSLEGLKKNIKRRIDRLTDEHFEELIKQFPYLVEDYDGSSSGVKKQESDTHANI